jgi:hypothetical protein
MTTNRNPATRTFYEDDPKAVADLGSPRMGRPPRALLGQTLDTLQVIARAEPAAGVCWLCRCQVCGEELIAETQRLQEGRVFCPCTGKKPPAIGRPRTRPERVQPRGRYKTSATLYYRTCLGAPCEHGSLGS